MIDVNNLTDGNINGDGTFDKLMTSVTAHIERQYKNSRITGSDYSNVYLGSLTAVLNQASTFLLQSEQLNKQLLLLDEQIANVKANSELVDAQIVKLQADTALVNQNILTSQAQLVLVEKQQVKSDKESELLEQKLVTEIAQTVGSETTVEGVLGKQMELIQKQAEGFDRNSEQKLAKMLIDTWTVRQSTDGADTLNNGLADSEINKVLNLAKQGVGLAPFTPD